MTAAVEGLRAACLVEGIELLEEIGAGASATVWRAAWRGHDVAVKVAQSDRGAGLARPPRHPAVVRVLSEGRALGRPYQVLERFPTDLGRFLAGRPLRRDLWRPVLLPLLDALEHAHQRGQAHGDLKPGNVLLDPHASPLRVALADFGQATEAPDLELSVVSAEPERLGQGAATLPYLSPERLAGGPAAPASDVFALGVLLFELATGRRPAGLELPSELEPSTDPRLDLLVKGCLARDPARRPGLDGLRRELLRIFGGARPSGGTPAGSSAAGSSAAVSSVVDGADGMVHVPAGFVVIGDRDDPQARPLHEVRLEAYWIDRVPVTNRAYLEFVVATGAARPATWPASGRLATRLLDLPVSGVSWDAAARYAAWAGRRLPTEAEWERAAQGPEHRSYPYGDELDLARIHTDPRALSPVGQRPGGASSEGVHDLTGNGWEWTASVFRPYGAPAPSSGSAGSRVIRGGYDPASARSANAHARRGLRIDARDPGLTFRCARGG